MRYPECKQYLSSLGSEVLGMHPGLESIEAALQRLAEPQRDYPSVLVAGTNGKGSVSRFLASMLQRCGLRVGHYSSPHLISLRERIRVNGRRIPRDDFAQLFTRVVKSLEGDRLTYFESLTATAFLYFARCEIEIAVLEVGMGGRLDATNVVDPIVTVLTPISLDHQQFLGDSVAEIASEKAGTIRAGRPVVSAPQQEEAARVIRRVSTRREAPLFMLEDSLFQSVSRSDGCFRIVGESVQADLKLPGRHQVENAGLAVCAAQQLAKELKWDLGEVCLNRGLSAVTPEGRLHRLGRAPEVFLDSGHNPAAAKAVGAFLEECTSPPRHLVISMMRDKDLDGVAKILAPLFAKQWVVEMDSPRAAGLDQLRHAFPSASLARDGIEALGQAKAGAATVLVFGSFYLVGEILENG